MILADRVIVFCPLCGGWQIDREVSDLEARPLIEFAIRAHLGECPAIPRRSEPPRRESLVERVCGVLAHLIERAEALARR